MYSRPGCHLCDDARAVLDRIGEPFTEIDITTDDALHAAYLERIPVVALDGVELFDYFVDEPALRGHLSLHPPDRPTPAHPRSAVDTS
jgi:glutaredoxin